MFEFLISFMNRRHKRLRTLQKIARILLPVILISSILLLYRGDRKGPNPGSSSSPESLRSRPAVEFAHGTDVIWQIPDDPKAVLFIAHGCNCRAVNFWDPSPACPNCVGLPEDRIIVLRALERGFAVLTVSSSGRCWTFGKEVGIVKSIVESWIREHKLENLPAAALGASSGGYFVSALAKEMGFSSIALMIAEGVFDSMGVPVGYPPTLFVHMPKDVRRLRMIEKNMEALRKKGVEVKEIRCMEFPLTPTLLSDRIPGLDQNSSSQLFELFREKGFTDQRGYLRKDGRATPWKEAIGKVDVLMRRHELLDHIQEELNLAFAYHEMTSLPIGDILDWFDSNMKQSTF